MYHTINAASVELDNSSVFEMFDFDEIHYDCVVGYMWTNNKKPLEAARYFGVLGDDSSTCNVRLTEALQALLNMNVNGHALQDRLQFSDKGRALLKQARAALGVAL